MTTRRYTASSIFGDRYGTSTTCLRIRQAIASNTVRTTTYITKENERLDILAGQFYGDGRLWWILASSSGVGFAPQIPSNTHLLIPNLDDIIKLIG